MNQSSMARARRQARSRQAQQSIPLPMACLLAGLTVGLSVGMVGMWLAVILWGKP